MGVLAVVCVGVGVGVAVSVRGPPVTMTLPSVPPAFGMGAPERSAISTELTVRGYVPCDAVTAMSMSQVYRTDPSGIGLTF